MTGELGILNVGAGDIKVSFDKSNPAERIRASRIVKDMLKRGYALLVEVDRNGQKAFERATAFDENTCEYIVADFDPIQAERTDEQEEIDRAIAGIDKSERERHEETTAPGSEEAPRQQAETVVDEKGSKRGRRGRYRKVDAAGTRAVGVGRSAGG